MQQFNFTGNPEWSEGATIFFITEEGKVTVLDFSHCECVPHFYFVLYKMTQYNTLSVKLSNSQLNKLRSGIENGTEVILKMFFKCCWWF